MVRRYAAPPFKILPSDFGEVIAMMTMMRRAVARLLHRHVVAASIVARIREYTAS